MLALPMALLVWCGVVFVSCGAVWCGMVSVRSGLFRNLYGTVRTHYTGRLTT